MSGSNKNNPTKAEQKKENYTGVERAAIILQELGEEHAAMVIRSMDEASVSRIVTAWAGMKMASVDTRETIMSDFIVQMNNNGIAGDTLKVVKNTLISALGEIQANEIIRRLSKSDRSSAFALPQNTDARSLAIHMQGERPQTIALLFANLAPEMISEMISHLPEDLGIEAMYRYARLDNVPQNAVSELRNMIEEMASTSSSSGRRLSNLGGAKPTADVLNHLHADQSKAILEGIKARHKETGEKIEENLFTFQDLDRLDDATLMSIIREVQFEVLAKAMRNVDKNMRDRFFANMSKKQQDRLNEELVGGRPLKKSDVSEAQTQIVNIALKMRDEGKISINATEEMV